MSLLASDLLWAILAILGAGFCIGLMTFWWHDTDGSEW